MGLTDTHSPASMRENIRLLDQFYALYSATLTALLCIGVPFFILRKGVSAAVIVVLLGIIAACWKRSRSGQPASSIQWFATLSGIVATVFIFFGADPWLSLLIVSNAVVLATISRIREGVAYCVVFMAAWLLYLVLLEQGIHLHQYFVRNMQLAWFGTAVSFTIILMPIPRLVAQIRAERERADAINQTLREHQAHLQQLVEERTHLAESARRSAERANQAKSVFLTNMSHELRTPLHGVLSFAALGAKRTAEDENLAKLQRYFTHIAESGQRLQSLLDSVLLVSDVQSQAMSLDMNPQAIGTLIETAARRWHANGRGNIALEITHRAGAKRCICDQEKIALVMQHVLENAYRYAPGSPLHVDIATIEDDSGQAPAVRIAIRDQGQGIPEAEQESVFEAFVESSRSANGAGGRGLGLAVCRAIVNAHGGTIHAQSGSHGGCEIIVILPVLAEPAAAVPT